MSDQLAYIADIASFYQSIISILALVLGVLSVVAFITIRHTSKLAAEDMAAEAAKRAIQDSRTILEDIDESVEEIFARSAMPRIERLEDQIKILTDTLKQLRIEQERVPDMQVVPGSGPGAPGSPTGTGGPAPSGSGEVPGDALPGPSTAPAAGVPLAPSADQPPPDVADGTPAIVDKPESKLPPIGDGK